MLVKAANVLLPVVIVVVGCGWPREIRLATYIGIAACALWNTPATYASVDEATTCLKVLHSMMMGQKGAGSEDWFVPMEASSFGCN